MWSTYICDLHTYVIYIHMWSTYICDLHTYVIYIHMWSTYICDLHMWYVTLGFWVFRSQFGNHPFRQLTNLSLKDTRLNLAKKIQSSEAFKEKVFLSFFYFPKKKPSNPTCMHMYIHTYEHTNVIALIPRENAASNVTIAHNFIYV
jgi:hypothetical protein